MIQHDLCNHQKGQVFDYQSTDFTGKLIVDTTPEEVTGKVLKAPELWFGGQDILVCNQILA